MAAAKVSIFLKNFNLKKFQQELQHTKLLEGSSDQADTPPEIGNPEGIFLIYEKFGTFGIFQPREWLGWCASFFLILSFPIFMSVCLINVFLNTEFVKN